MTDKLVRGCYGFTRQLGSVKEDETYVFLATLDPVVVAAVPPVLRLSEAVVAGVVALELLALEACDCFFPMNVRKTGTEYMVSDNVISVCVAAFN